MKEFYKAIRFMATMAFSCVLSVFLGMWLDDVFHCSPILLLILLLYAICANLYLLMKGM
ncbi:MAG: AtpZ/AtpI family protein [Longicatena sp.]